MRTVFWSCLAATCLLVLSGDSPAQTGSSPPNIPRYSYPPPLADDKIPKLEGPIDKLIAALETRGNYDWNDLTLPQLAKAISEQHKIPVVVDRQKLEAAGVADQTVRCVRRDIRLESALDCALRGTEVRVATDGHVFHLTTKEESQSRLVTQSYWVGDLLPADPDAAESSSLDMAEAIIDLIAGCILPSTWDAVGGPGTIRNFRDVLIVSQTLDVQIEIRRFLALIREAKRRNHAADYSQPSLSSFSKDDDGIRKRLATSLDVAVQDQPLSDFLRKLADDYKLPIEIDRVKIEEAGQDLSQAVNVDLKGVPLRNVLATILAPRDLGIVVRGESVLVTTQEVMKITLSTRLYPVGDLVDDKRLPYCDSDDLIDLITTTVAPPTWDSAGGPGPIKYLAAARALAIAQTDDVHEEVGTLLTDLRKLRAAGAKASAHLRAQVAEEEAKSLRLVSFSLQPAVKDEDLKQYTKDIAEMVRELVEPKSWGEEGVYLRPLAGKLVVRHRADVLRKIAKVLTEIHVLEPPQTPGVGVAF